MRRLCLALAIAAPLAAQAAQEPAPASVSVCFTPGPTSCAEMPIILRPIAGAKRRGLDVAAILDKSQDRRNSVRSRYTGATDLAP